MMYLTDTGIAYAEGFFYLKDGRVFNSLTGRSVGVAVRRIYSENYLKERKPTIWKKIGDYIVDTVNQARVDWERIQHQEELEMRIDEDAKGELVKTMRGLEKDKWS